MERERKTIINKRWLRIAAAWSALSAGAVIAAVGQESEIPAGGEDGQAYQPTNERMIDPSLSMQLLAASEAVRPKVEPTPSPTAVGQKEKSVGRVVKGPATFYGVYDQYGPEDPLGCTGESFNPYDPTTAARPENSPFECGDKVRVCDKNSCIDVEIKDTCPGCDDFGIVVDLSYGAMRELSPGSGKVTVTMEELK